jgi:hypothetical protein
MSETTIVYNNVTIKNVLTDDINQEVVQDSTGVDPIYIRVTGTFTGIIHAVSPGIPVTIGMTVQGLGTDLASGYNVVIDDLLQPRRPFLMMVGASALFNIVPGMVEPGVPNPNFGDTVPIRRTDCNHGPITSVKLLNIISANTMKIQFRIVMHLPYCDSDGTGLNSSGALSLRFWISEDIDYTDWTTERIYQGVFRVRHMGHNVLTQIRNNFIFPGLVEGFVRRHITLSQRPNGLELDFQIRDKEVWAVPPYPATHWEAFQTVTCPRPGLAMMESEVMVRLKGDKNTSKLVLLQLLQTIMDHKLHRTDMTYDGQSFPLFLQYRDNLPNNEVEGIARINLVGTQHVLWNVPKEKFGHPLKAPEFADYNKERAKIGSPTACIRGLFLAFLNNPCHISQLPTANEDARQIVFPGLTCTISTPEQGELPPYENGYSSEHKSAGAYHVYRMRSRSHTNSGVIQLPFGKTSGSSGSSVDTAVILQLHQPVGQRWVDLEAERLQTWPSIPSPEEFSSNPGGIRHVIVDKTETPSAPMLSVDGKKTLYHIASRYYYAHNRAPNVGEIPSCLMPYRIQSSAGEPIFVVPATAYKSPYGFLTA